MPATALTFEGISAEGQLVNGFSYLFFYAVCFTAIFDISSTAVNMEETNQPLAFH